MVVPDLTSEPGIDGPNIVGDREVKNAVHFQRSRFDGGRVRVENPGEREGVNVCGVDLVERAESLSGIVSVIGRPSIHRGLYHVRLIDLLPCDWRCLMAKGEELKGV